MKVGKYTYNAENIRIFTWNEGAELEIGSFCSIADGVNVFLGGNHRTDRITTFPFGHIHKNVFSTFNGRGHPATNGNVRIGNDVWIGFGATIMSGVTIGDGAVIAANSHVVKDVEPYTIVGGNPARAIRTRFVPDVIQKLLAIRWWDWDDKMIDKATPLLCSDNFDGLFKFAASLKAPR